MTQTLLQTVLPFVVSALGLAGTAALGFLAKWLADKGKTSRIAHALSVVTEQAQSIVADIEVNERQEVTQVFSDGRISAEEGAKLKAIALARLQAALPNASKAVLADVFGVGVEGWLSGIIERVHSAQQTPAVAVAPVAPTVVATKFPAGLSDPGRTAEFTAPLATPR